MTGRWICLWCCLWLSLAGACLPPAGKDPAFGALSFPNLDLVATAALTCELDGNHLEPCAYGGGRCADASAAFGRSRRSSDQVLDEESGFHYHNARYLDSGLTRSIQPHTIGPNLLDPLRFGSEAGRMWVEGGTPGQIALGAVQEGLRAAAIVPGVVLAAKFTGVIRSAATAESAATSAALGNTARGSSAVAAKTAPTPRLPGPNVDPLTGQRVGRFIGTEQGPAMIEPLGGSTPKLGFGKGGVDTHTLYPNGANYQRLNPFGHGNNPTPHAQGHAPGTGPAIKGQGPSLDTFGNVVPWNSPDAHWPFP